MKKYRILKKEPSGDLFHELVTVPDEDYQVPDGFTWNGLIIEK